MASAKSRATRSVGPPAAKGTTMVMTLSLAGKSAACAEENMPQTAKAAPAMAVDVLKNDFIEASPKNTDKKQLS
jgi:hypothetical protein